MQAVKNREAITETIRKTNISEVNEMNVTKHWLCFWPVSPAAVWFYSAAVINFIVGLHIIFSLFHAILNFWFFWFKPKEQKTDLPVFHLILKN